MDYGLFWGIRRLVGQKVLITAVYCLAMCLFGLEHMKSSHVDIGMHAPARIESFPYVITEYRYYMLISGMTALTEGHLRSPFCTTQGLFLKKSQVNNNNTRISNEMPRLGRGRLLRHWWALLRLEML